MAYSAISCFLLIGVLTSLGWASEGALVLGSIIILLTTRSENIDIKKITF